VTSNEKLEKASHNNTKRKITVEDKNSVLLKIRNEQT
jgi:hypothetical protein